MACLIVVVDLKVKPRSQFPTGGGENWNNMRRNFVYQFSTEAVSTV